MQCIDSLAKKEAKNTRESLSLLENSRLGIAEKIGHAFMSNECMVDNGYTLLIDRNNDIREASNEKLDIIWLLIHRCTHKGLHFDSLSELLTLLMLKTTTKIRLNQL